MGNYKELADRLWKGAGGLSDEQLDDLMREAAIAVEHLRNINAAAEAKQKLLLLAKLTAEAQRLHDELAKDWLEDCAYWGTDEIYHNCTIDDEGLKDAAGNLLSDDGRCMDEPFGYFVNQSCGYCEDDYYGTMFVAVDDNGTFVGVTYSC